MMRLAPSFSPSMILTARLTSLLSGGLRRQSGFPSPQSLQPMATMTGGDENDGVAFAYQQSGRMKLHLRVKSKVYNRVCFVLAICVGLVLSTACVSTPHGSAELAELSERDRHSLSSVIVAALQQHFMPAKTVFALRPAGPVGQRVAQRLQQLGYGVTPQQQADTQWLRYRISYHQERVIYLSLAVDTGWRLDRLYIPDIHGELRPANMATLRDDDQPRRPPAPAISRSAPGNRF